MVLVFIVLAAQYESWSLPLAILLIVPMCLLSALAGLWAKGLDNDIFAQIGFVVLIGLAAKNAILVVEFSKQLEDGGLGRVGGGGRGRAHAAAADRDDLVRLYPRRLAVGVGAGRGAEMRVPLGVAVAAGMLGVTFFGLAFTPVFYSVVMWLSGGTSKASKAVPEERTEP